ncbi:MAG: hypothetical protein ACKN85_08845 [Pirellula sp.]
MRWNQRFVDDRRDSGRSTSYGRRYASGNRRKLNTCRRLRGASDGGDPTPRWLIILLLLVAILIWSSNAVQAAGWLIR